jgi:hypothetical protein
MTPKQIKQKLERLVEICNELDEEAKRRWGPDGNLFFESDGTFHMMSGDCNGFSRQRQSYVAFSSQTHCQLGAGAW